MPSKREQLLEIMEDAAKGETKATLRARIAELEAENERLKYRSDHYEDLSGARHLEIRRLKLEALSRTGAVKVKALTWSDHPAGGEQALGAGLGLYRVHANGDDWYLVPDHMGNGGKAAAQADYERRILSALEPAAPEGQQESMEISDGDFLAQVKDDAALWAAEFRKTALRLGYSNMDEGWLIGWFANAIENTEIVRRDQWSRPAEQAVTDAMVEAAREIIHGARHIYSDIDLARAVLKAAMEAGRHD